MGIQPDLLPCTVLVCLGVFGLFMSRRVLGSFLAPPGVFAVVWFFSLALLYTNVIAYDPITPSTLAIFIVTAVLFIVGVLMPGLIFRSTPRSVHYRVTEFDRGLLGAIMVLLAIGIAGSIMYYLRLNQLIGISSLWTNSRLVRFEESAGDLRHTGAIGLARGLLIPCFALAVTRHRFSVGRERKALVVVAVICFLSFIANSGRSISIEMVGWAIFATAYSRQVWPLNERDIRPLFWVVGALLACLGYFVITTGLLHKDLGSYLSVSDVSGLPPELSIFADLTNYIVAGFPSFQELIATAAGGSGSSSLTFGVISRVFSAVFPQVFSSPDYVLPYVYTPLPSNIYTYLDAYYLDYGMEAVLVFPLLTGMVVGTLYQCMRHWPSTFKVYIASLTSVCILDVTLNNIFGQFQTWIWIIVPLFLTRACYFLATNRRIKGGAPDLSMREGSVVVA